MTVLRALESGMGFVGMCLVLVTRMGSVLAAQLPMISSLKASSLQLWLIS